jgi:hypothetical protein
VVVSQTAVTTGSQSLLEPKQVVSLVTQPKIAPVAPLAALTTAHRDLQMTELSAKSGQTSLATARAEMTVQSVRAGQTDLPMEIETQALVTQTHAALIPVVQIPEASVSQPPDQIVLGNQDHLLPAQTLTVLGNHVLQDLTDQTDLPMTETHLTETIPTVPSDQLAQTLTVLGNHVLQDRTDLSVPVTREVSLLVQTHASMTGTETPTARTASQEIVQGMRAS